MSENRKPANEDRRMCAGCGESLGEEALMALNRLWHPQHFVCNACEKPIRQTFQVNGGRAFCVQCYGSMFNPKCAGCQDLLTDTCLLALDRHWHPRCFVCTHCHKPLANGEYYLVDEQPYDLDCHWERRLEKRGQLGNERQQY